MDTEFINLMKKQQTLFSIISLLSVRPRTIAELSRELKINRSTLRYYLYTLQSEKRIEFKRHENEPGRPTYISLNQDTINQESINRESKLKEYREQMNNNELVHFLRSLFKNNEFYTLEDIIKKVDDSKIKVEEPKFSKILSALSYIEIHFEEIANGWKCTTQINKMEDKK